MSFYGSHLELAGSRAGHLKCHHGPEALGRLLILHIAEFCFSRVRGGAWIFECLKKKKIPGDNPRLLWVDCHTLRNIGSSLLTSKNRSYVVLYFSFIKYGYGQLIQVHDQIVHSPPSEALFVAMSWVFTWEYNSYLLEKVRLFYKIRV